MNCKRCNNKTEEKQVNIRDISGFEWVGKELKTAYKDPNYKYHVCPKCKRQTKKKLVK